MISMFVFMWKCHAQTQERLNQGGYGFLGQDEEREREREREKENVEKKSILEGFEQNNYITHVTSENMLCWLNKMMRL